MSHNRAVYMQLAAWLLVFYAFVLPRELPAQNLTLSTVQSDAISNMVVEADRLSGSEKSDQAIALLKKALKNLEEYYAPRLKTITLSRLAALTADQGELQTAERFSRSALSLIAETEGTNTADYAIAAANLASVLTTEAHYIEADGLIRTALRIGRERLNSHSQRFADLLAVSAELLVLQDHSRKAIHVLREEMKIRELQRGENQQLAHTYLNLAVAYKEVGKVSLGIEAIHKAERLLSANSTLKLYGQSTLLVLYEANHQYDKADLLIRAVLGQIETCYAKNPAQAANILNNIGVIYEHRLREQEAAAMFSRAYRINLDVLGPSHPRTAYALMNYGQTLIKLGQAEEGRILATQARALLGILH